MNHVEIQAIYVSHDLPDAGQIQSWVDTALQDHANDSEIVVRIVGEQESAELNKLYRHKNGPTNILSFPADLPEGIGLNLLGDLVVCAPVLEQEALEQGKSLAHHWAHIIIHGMLHLLGYDHVDEDDAETMEALEISMLNKLNIINPYLEKSEP
jgi:probable rRNA maturation factor